MTTTYDQSTVTYDQSSLTYQGLPAQFDGVAFAVEMAFGYEPLDDDPSWESVTPYVRGFTINRGRNSEFSTYGPGTVSIALDNRDRRFDPEHTSGPYFGDLNPMVPVRVQATYSGVTYTMFYGFVQGWPTVYNQSNTDAVASVNAIDANRLLGNTLLASSAFTREVEVDEPFLHFPMQSFELQDITYLGTVRDFYVSEDSTGANRLIGPFVSGDVRTETYAYPVGPSRASGVVIDTYWRPGSAYGNPPKQMENVRAIEFWWLGKSRGWTGNISQQAGAGRSDAGNRLYMNVLLFYTASTDSWAINSGRYQSEALNVDGSYSVTPITVRDDMNHFLMTKSGSNLNTYVNGVLVQTTALTTPSSFIPRDNEMRLAGPLIPTGGDTNRVWYSHFTTYTKEFSTADVQRHYDAGLGFFDELSSTRLTRVLDEVSWPSAFRDIETGVQTVGAYRPESLAVPRYYDQIDNAEQGSLFVNREGDVEFRSRSTAEAVLPVGLFDDSGTDLPFANVSVDAHTVDAIRNNVVVNYANGLTTSTDAGSVAAYGQASETVDARLLDDATVAQSIGDTRLLRAKDPRTRVTRLDVNVRRDPAGLVPVVAALDLSDDVTVSLTPTGVGSALWRAVRVQGLSHTVTPQSWDVSLYLAPGPINTNGPLLVLDDGTYGVLDSNKLG